MNTRVAALLLSIISFIAIPFAASAQFRWAPVAGVTVNDLDFKQDLFPVDKTVGMQAGVMGELMFPGIGFGIDFALLYNQMGAKTHLGDRKIWAADGFKDPNVMIHTLQIPLHVRFKWTRMQGLEDYIAPFVYGGPDFALSVGHSRIKGDNGADNPYKFSGGDLGLTAGGGFELWRRWQVSVQYTWGMTYLLKTRKLDNQSAKNRQWAVRVAYFF
ncbi:MAG: porin family protein [Muribaculaceae bacterium]|nr:porin family protein [Muribaculaceae bacterium]